jgi:SAM-dependent methyltransferase
MTQMTDTTQTTETTRAYALGHSPEEQRRLDQQGAILRPHSERLLRDAGIGPGQRVLDVGCGTADVTLLVAELVGAGGEVVGVDRAAEVLATARTRALGRGLANVRFVQAELGAFAPAERFDAVVGRNVLMHQSDPAAALGQLAHRLRPGGVLAFAEPLLFSPPLAAADRPLIARCMRWLVQAFGRVGAWPDMGLRLHQAFLDAGLPAPRVRLDGVLIGGADPSAVAWLAGTVRSLLPLIERFELATAAEVDIDTLVDRLLDEARAHGGAACGYAQGGAWVRLPAA